MEGKGKGKGEEEERCVGHGGSQHTTRLTTHNTPPHITPHNTQHTTSHHTSHLMTPTTHSTAHPIPRHPRIGSTLAEPHDEAPMRRSADPLAIEAPRRYPHHHTTKHLRYQRTDTATKALTQHQSTSTATKAPPQLPKKLHSYQSTSTAQKALHFHSDQNTDTPTKALPGHLHTHPLSKRTTPTLATSKLPPHTLTSPASTLRRPPPKQRVCVCACVCVCLWRTKQSQHTAGRQPRPAGRSNATTADRSWPSWARGLRR